MADNFYLFSNHFEVAYSLKISYQLSMKAKAAKGEMEEKLSFPAIESERKESNPGDRR